MTIPAGWLDIKNAPRDGTRICLASINNGEVDEWFYPMSWSHTTTNPLVQSHKGIWVMVGHDSKIVYTWGEADGFGPECWLPAPPVRVE